MSWKIGEILNIIAPILDFIAFWLLLISETRTRKTRPRAGKKDFNPNNFLANSAYGYDLSLESKRELSITNNMYRFSIALIVISSILWIASGILQHYDL
jgi:hypothetical protein